MFTFLLFPGFQKKLKIVFNDTLNLSQVNWRKFAFACNFDGFQPEFGFIPTWTCGGSATSAI